MNFRLTHELCVYMRLRPIASFPSVAIARPTKEAKVHIKKPLNAFMLFMKKNRSGVIKQHTLKESAAINKILGQMVCRMNVLAISNLNLKCVCVSLCVPLFRNCSGGEG